MKIPIGALTLILFLAGFIYLYMNGTYWLEKYKRMSDFVDFYYVNGTIFVENHYKDAEFRLIFDNETMDFMLKKGDIKRIKRDIDGDIYLIYENESLRLGD